MSKTTTKSNTTEISADDLALWAAIILVVGDLFGLFSVLKARSEKNNDI